ncbi:MAG TPA: hypothetical protein VH740_21170 [Vicinamibacterales bacterium]|jgi:hypothetical protein
MTISEIVKQGFYYARTCKSLWLFGFFVGMASGGSSGGGGGGRNGGGSGGLEFSAAQFAFLAIVIALCLLVLIVMRFVSEGALIEGIARVRKGGTMTTREGFRAGWAHWGVLVRIALIYVAATVGSLALLVAPCVLAWQTLGPLGGIALAIPAVVIGVPWLVTLHLVQAFASRIAVLENRHALDAIAKARLFLHGRLMHGLALIAATFVGTLLMVFAAVVVVVPVALLLVALTSVLRIIPVIVLACVVLLPVFYVFTAMVGTLRSSIWTIGYVSQVES